PQPGIVDYAGRTTDERCFKGQYAHFGVSSISKIAMSHLEAESPAVKKRLSIFHFLTPVWGEPYTRLFVDTVIPAQLAGGKLAAFRGEAGHRYIIYTRPQDAEIIRSSAAYASLNECVPVTVEFITERIDLVHDMMTDCYRRGIAEANKADAAAIF